MSDDPEGRKKLLPPPLLGGLAPPTPDAPAPPPHPTAPPPSSLARQDLPDPAVAGFADVPGARQSRGVEQAGVQHAATSEHGAGAQHTAHGQGLDAPTDITRHTPDQQTGAAGQSGGPQHPQPAHSQPGQPGGAQHQFGGETGGHGEAGGVHGGHGGQVGRDVGQSGRYAGDAVGESGRAAQRSASAAERSGSRVWRWRNFRPRYKLAVVGGSSALAIAAAGALTLANRDEDSTAKPPPAAVTTVVAPVSTAAGPVAVTVPATEAPVATGAPVATEAPDTTEAPTTVAPSTTVEPATTVVASSSFAGVYGVTTSDITLTGGGFSQTLPGSGPDTWTLTGPCDGVGECTITAEGGVASTGASPFAGPGGEIPLVPGGAGTYTSTYDLFVETCGTGTSVIVLTIGSGSLTGSYGFSVAGGECAFATLSMTFSGALSG